MANQEHTEQLKLHLDGKLEDVGANVVIETLLSLSGLMEEISNDLYPANKFELRVAAPEKGSFILDLIVILPVVDYIQQNISLQDVTNVATIVGVLATLFEVRKHRKSGQSFKVDEIDTQVELTNSEGSVIIVDKSIYKLYTTNLIVSESIDKTIRAISSDEKIESFDILDSADTPLFSASRDEFEPMSYGDFGLDDSASKSNPVRTQIWIVKPSFESTLRWQFIYNGRRIGAKIVDEEFIERVEAGRERFANGDYLVVDLVINQVFDKKYGTYLDHSYVVEKVYEHCVYKDQPSFEYGIRDILAEGEDEEEIDEDNIED